VLNGAPRSVTNSNDDSALALEAAQRPESWCTDGERSGAELQGASYGLRLCATKGLVSIPA